MAGHVINYKDGGIGLEFRGDPSSLKKGEKVKVDIESVSIFVCFTATHRNSIQL